MHDRVVDRAAAHATPADLAVRDWLLAALSFATGAYEAICFLTFGKVFTGFQTGNIVFLGFGVAGTRQPAGPNLITVVISLAAFAAGAALAMPVLEAFDGDQETEDNNVFQAWPRRVSIALAIALIPQAGFLGDWMLSHAHPYAPAVPAVVTAVVIAIASVALKPRATSGPAGTAGSEVSISGRLGPGPVAHVPRLVAGPGGGERRVRGRHVHGDHGC